MLNIIGSVGNQKSKVSPGTNLYSGIESGTRKTRRKNNSRMEKSKKTIVSNRRGRPFNKSSFLVVRYAFARMNKDVIPTIPISYFRLINFYSLCCCLIKSAITIENTPKNSADNVDRIIIIDFFG